jgi:hypothetical protein
MKKVNGRPPAVCVEDDAGTVDVTRLVEVTVEG